MHNRLGYRFTGRLDIAAWIERKQQGAAGEIVCAVTRFAARTGSAGSQSITTDDLGGLIPKAVIFIATRCITDAVAASHTQFSFGAATGPANEWCLTANSEDGQTTSDAEHETTDTGCILFTIPGTATDIAKADFTEFIENGCTLNWSNVDAAFLITAVFFAGADLSAHANTIDPGNIVNQETDVVDPGFEPDIVIASVIGSTSINSSGSSFIHSVGFCSNDGEGGVVQRCAAQAFASGQGTTVSNAYSRNDCTVFTPFGGGAPDWRGSFGSFDTDGFTVTTLDNGGNNAGLGYLALNFGGATSSWVGTHTAPVGAGNNSDTGPNFPPQIVLRVMTQVATVNTRIESGDSCGAYGFSAMDADEAYSASVSDEDAIVLNPATTNALSLSDDVAIELPDDDGTVGLTAAFVSFDADGWTENYTAVKGTSGLMPALAIGE